MNPLSPTRGGRGRALSGLGPPPDVDTWARRRLVTALFVAYGSSVLVHRHALVAINPAMLQSLGEPMEAAGAMLSIGAGAYAICKPISQILSDGVLDARWMLVASNVLSACCFIAMGLSTSVGCVKLSILVAFATQAMHSPAMIKMITRWYGPQHSGTPFAVVSCSSPIVITSLPLLVPFIMSYSVGQDAGWRTVCFVLGAVTIALQFVLVAPHVKSYPPLPVCSPPRRPRGKSHDAGAGEVPAGPCSPLMLPPGAANVWDMTETDPASPSAAAGGVGMCTVAQRWQIWMLGVSLMCLFLIRNGIEAWLTTYLVERPTLGAAAAVGDGSSAGGAFMLWWPLGGFLGSLLAGPLTDRMGLRLPAAAVSSSLILTGFALVLPALDGASPQWVVAASGLLGGICVFGQRTLLILSTREQVPTEAGGKAGAIVNMLGEAGGVLAGLPLVTLVRRTSWAAFHLVGQGAAVVLIALNAVLLVDELYVKGRCRSVYDGAHEVNGEARDAAPSKPRASDGVLEEDVAAGGAQRARRGKIKKS